MVLIPALAQGECRLGADSGCGRLAASTSALRPFRLFIPPVLQPSPCAMLMTSATMRSRAP